VARRGNTHRLSLRRDRRGAAAVELALVAFPFVMTLMAFMETGHYLFCLAALDNGVQEAARQIMTGQVQNASQQLSAAQFRTSILCPLLPSTFNCNNVIVQIQTFTESGSPGGFYSFVNANQSGLNSPPLNNSQTSYCVGTGSAYVFVEVVYPMPLLTGAFAATATTFNGQQVMLLTSGAAFRNEPFQAPGYKAPQGC